MNKSNILGKVAFGSLFVILFPLLLVSWAYYTEDVIRLPVPDHPVFSWISIILGTLFIVLAMINLWHFGQGLPMNAYPPRQYVTKGLYAFSRNPIYLGTALLSFGLSAYFQSASGFWLVSPLLVVITWVYTVGFENERTEKHFGKQHHKPFLTLPAKSDMPLTIKERMAALLLAYLPWLLVYEAFIFLGAPKDAVVTNTILDYEIPLIELSVVFYGITYLYALLLPFVLKTKKQLRSLIIDILLATGISALLYFCLPFVILQRSFVPETLFGNLLLLDRLYDGPSAAFPAFHTIWAFIAARYFSLSFRNGKWIWYGLGILISISCLSTWNHSIVDVGAGIAVFLLLVYKYGIWNGIRKASERISNSWKEWHIGPVRIINHGFYAALAAGTGTAIIGSLSEEGKSFTAFFIGVFAIIGAALWAQIIEGSPRLQRPYGYYGSVVGASIGALLMVALFDTNFMLLSGAVSMAAPWVQVAGRFRCMVQGCCHGKPSPEWLGIRFIHPLSRVNQISGLKGVCIHPTQLYSIGTNLITGIILIRLFQLQMPASLITGIYFLFNALGRFVEEYFRGETQTPYWLGMRIYQWIAVFFMVIGAVFTCLPSPALRAPIFDLNTLFWTLIMALVSLIAYGVDFPGSNKRFARLGS